MYLRYSRFHWGRLLYIHTSNTKFSCGNHFA